MITSSSVEESRGLLVSMRMSAFDKSARDELAAAKVSAKNQRRADSLTLWVGHNMLTRDT